LRKAALRGTRQIGGDVMAKKPPIEVVVVQVTVPESALVLAVPEQKSRTFYAAILQQVGGELEPMGLYPTPADAHKAAVLHIANLRCVRGGVLTS